jgi:hypothetical protein
MAIGRVGTPWTRRIAAGILWASLGFSQTQLNGVGGNLRIIGTDMAILETQEVRHDLPCTVTPSKPLLGFDLRFHTGYDVTIPLRELEGNENMLTILMRVTPQNRKEEQTFFVQRVHVPKIEEDAKGEATLGGLIDVGEGNYHVDWLMRDRAERVCSFYWDSEAMLPAKDKQMELGIGPGVVEQTSVEQFGEEPPVARTGDTEPLNIKVLVNFAPQRAGAASLRPADTLALVTMMRRIVEEPKFGKFSVTAFNIQEQRVLYRQSSESKIDFPALGEAVSAIQPGVTDAKRLSQKRGETEFLASLIKEEFGGSDRPDAVIIASPKAMLEESVNEDELKKFAGEVDYPVFYMNYNLNPQATPWRDSIGRAVKVFRGTEYTVTRPRDLWVAITEMVNRIVQSKHGRTATSFASQ